MYPYRSLLSPKLKTFLRLESFQKSRTKQRPLLLARSVFYLSVTTHLYTDLNALENTCVMFAAPCQAL